MILSYKSTTKLQLCLCQKKSKNSSPPPPQLLLFFFFLRTYMPTSSSSTVHESKTIPRRSKPNSTSITKSIMKKNQDPKKIVNSNVPVKVKKVVMYRECRKNHAARVGGYAVDGCMEFMASGEEGTAGALLCAACDCHRSFHKREVGREVLCDCSSNSTSPR